MSQKVDIAVRGIHCEACERTIERALSRLPGVLQVKADHGDAMVHLVMREGQDGLEESVQSRLSELGFEPVRPAP